MINQVHELIRKAQSPCPIRLRDFSAPLNAAELPTRQPELSDYNASQPLELGPTDWLRPDQTQVVRTSARHLLPPSLRLSRCQPGLPRPSQDAECLRGGQTGDGSVLGRIDPQPAEEGRTHQQVRGVREGGETPGRETAPTPGLQGRPGAR